MNFNLNSTPDEHIWEQVEELPTAMREVFVKLAIQDARQALQERMSLDDLAFLFYKAYTLGAATRASALHLLQE